MSMRLVITTSVTGVQTWKQCIFNYSKSNPNRSFSTTFLQYNASTGSLVCLAPRYLLDVFKYDFKFDFNGLVFSIGACEEGITNMTDTMIQSS